MGNDSGVELGSVQGKPADWKRYCKRSCSARYLGGTFVGNRVVGIVDELSISRKRKIAVGVSLAAVGVFILFFSLTVLTGTIHAIPTGRRYEYNWPTILAGLALIALGVVVSIMRPRSERR